MIASTPAAASAAISSGSSTVHTSRRTPAPRRRAPPRDRGRAAHRRPVGVEPRVTRVPRRSAASSPAARPDVSHAVVTRASRVRTTSTASSSNDDTITVLVEAAPLRPARRHRAHDDAFGVGVGLGREALDLDVDEHGPASAVERLLERRHARHLGAQLRERVLDEQAEALDDRDRGSPRARRRRVRRTSSSTPSAPSSRASRKASRVFSGARRDAPRWASTSGRVGHRRHRRHPGSAATPEREPVSPLRANAQVRPLATRRATRH